MSAFNRDKKRSWSTANEDDSIQSGSPFEQIFLYDLQGSSSREPKLLAPESRGEIRLDHAGLLRESSLLVDDNGDLETLPQASIFTSFDESALSNRPPSTSLPRLNCRAGGLASSPQSPLSSPDPVSDSCSTLSTGVTSNPTPIFRREKFVEACYGTVNVTQATHRTMY
jgi:hypothetical protein